MKPRRIFKKVGRTLIAIVGIIICIGFIEGILENFYPASWETKSVERAHAFLFSTSHFHETPDKVEFIIHGNSKVFYKDTEAYTHLMNLLHEGRSEELREEAGQYPGFFRTKHWGTMIISSFGIPSHFKIGQSETNPKYFWIALPKLTSPGTSFPIFTVDPRVIALLLSNDAEQAHGAHDGNADLRIQAR